MESNPLVKDMQFKDKVVVLENASGDNRYGG